jgi:protein phosphatase
MPVTSASATDTGRRRSTNEDYLSVREDLGLFVVADGMGGHAAGEVASRMAVEGIVAFIEETVEMSPDQAWPVLLDPQVSFDPQQTVNGNRLRAAFCWGNRKIAQAVSLSPPELQTSGKPSMGTTAVALLIAGQAAIVAHVGDSRAYRLRQGQLEQLTRDHSEVEARIQAGWDPDDPALDDVRHVVTRALQGEQDLKVELQELSLKPSDRLLLCSDGVCAVLADDQIADVLRSQADLDEICQALVRDVNEGGGPDNVTAIVVEVDAV